MNTNTESYAAACEAIKVNPEWSHLSHLDPYAKASDVAKNVRKHLKKLHPGVKFSVTSDVNCIRVKAPDTWTFPECHALSSALSIFKAGNFDSMTDYYEVNHRPFTTVFGSTTYLFVSRK